MCQFFIKYLINPLSLELQNLLQLNNPVIVAAVCVYHHLVKECKSYLNNQIPIAAVSTGFPAGLSSFERRKKVISNSINAGADEIDIVINRAYVLQNDWQRLYNEVRTFKEIAK